MSSGHDGTSVFRSMPDPGCPGFPFPDLPSSPHAWRVLEWIPALPLAQEDADRLCALIPDVFAPAGPCRTAFFTEPDRILILLAHTVWSAPIHCDLSAWLCACVMLDRCAEAAEREGTLLISRSFSEAQQWQDAERLALSDWWSSVSPITPSESRRYRDLLLKELKRGRYDNLAGCTLRILRGIRDPGAFCAAFVPVAAEAVWSLYPGIPAADLTAGLSMPLLTRRPQDALLDWLASLPELLAKSSTASGEQGIERIRELIMQNPSFPYTQERLAHSLGLSPTYFCRLFHARTGQAFSAFLTGARIEKACELLKEGELSLQEIAETCGYPNKSYFCKVFHKYTGMAPGSYSDQCRNAPVPAEP